jgi:hypothetical protein
MRFQSGKHAGKTLDEVLLKQPDFAQWYIRKYPDAPAAKEFDRLMRKFDAKPFTKKCRCGKPATGASTYQNSPSLMFWCDECPPHSSGAERGKVAAVTSIRGVLGHIDWTADGYRAWKRDIVRKLAEGKGLPKRVGEQQALAFFSET